MYHNLLKEQKWPHLFCLQTFLTNVSTSTLLETFVKNVCKQNVNSRRNVGLIKSAMNVKLKDAEYDEDRVRKMFNSNLKEYIKVVISETQVDLFICLFFSD